MLPSFSQSKNKLISDFCTCWSGCVKFDSVKISFSWHASSSSSDTLYLFALFTSWFLFMFTFLELELFSLPSAVSQSSIYNYKVHNYFPCFLIYKYCGSYCSLCSYYFFYILFSSLFEPVIARKFGSFDIRLVSGSPANSLLPAIDLSLVI